MKKRVLSIMALSAVLFSFTSCMSLGAMLNTDTSNMEDYQNAVGTPENSVVFYGIMHGDKKHAFSQMDPAFPPDYQESKKMFFISKPVPLGSTYVLESSSGQYQGAVVGNTKIIYVWDSSYTLQSAANPLVVNVPKKPGLYWIGYFWGYPGSDGKLERIEKWEKYEASPLKSALKLYKGTAWEKAILERMEELKGGKKNEK
jgi:hypothetical protein